MSCVFLTCLFLLMFFGAQSITIVALPGETVTLSCKYNTKTHYTTSICWGRGEVPWSKCSDTLLSTNDRGRIIYRESERYQLQGRVRDGDVSLSIVNVQEGDSGMYGCRVELPGWFNDLKTNIQLTILTAPELQTSVITTPASDDNLSNKEDYDSPVVDSVYSKESPLSWTPNIVRMTVVIVMTVTAPFIIYGLTRLLKKKFHEGMT